MALVDAYTPNALLLMNMISSQVTFEHSTPLGPMVSAWTESGLYSLTWITEREQIAEREQSDIATSLGADRSDNPLDDLLAEYFQSGYADFSKIKIDPAGWTRFTCDVYHHCRQIEPGTTITYKQLASRAGSPNASRAAGSAMARNRVLIVIPCHRVVNSAGGLSGFSAPGGLNTKQFLLDLES